MNKPVYDDFEDWYNINCTNWSPIQKNIMKVAWLASKRHTKKRVLEILGDSTLQISTEYESCIERIKNL